MARTAILHIGPMKTGTTSIQAWLRRNRESLAAFGYHFPRAFGSANMSKLSQLADHFADGTQPDAELAGRWAKLTEELDSLPQHARSVVISGEMMGQHLRTRAQITALKRAFDPYFDDFRILLYLRRQDEISVSLFNTRVRQRSTPDSAILSEPMDYAQMLTAWGEVFGKAALEPRVFERSALVGNDIVTDFADALGLPEGAIDTRAKVKNQSFNTAAQSFISAVYDTVAARRGNKRLLDEDNYTLMINTLTRNFIGAGHMPARADAEAFVARMAASNEAVRAEWFPDRPRLFSDDFSKYPATRPAGPSAEEILEVAVTVTSELLVGAKRNERPERAAGNPDPQRRGRRARDEDADAAAEAWDIAPPETSAPEGDTEMTDDTARGERRKGGGGGKKGERDTPGFEPKLLAKAARALYRLANQDKERAGTAAGSRADRKAHFAEVKDEYQKEARRILRALQKEGIQFTLAAEDKDDVDETEAAES